MNVKGSLARERPVNLPNVSLALWMRWGGLWVRLRVERRWVVRKRERAISGLSIFWLLLVGFFVEREVMVGRPSMLAMWR